MRLRLAAAALAFSALLSPAHAADKLTVLLDWFVNPDHATLVLAKQNGIFAKHDLDVDLIAPADPNAPPKLVADGQADLAVTYQPNLQMQIAEGLPLMRVATLVDTPLNTLVALQGKGIGKIEDLKGKTVGFSIGGFEDALLGAMLENHGLKLSDVTLANVNFSLTPALMSNQAAAVIGAFRNFELTQIRLAGGTPLAFYPEENGVPLYDELVLVARKDKAKTPVMARFVAALEEATVYLLNHPDESWKAFITAYPDLNDELNRKAFQDTLTRFAKSPGALDKIRYERFGKFMVERGLVKDVPPVDTYAVDPR